MEARTEDLDRAPESAPTADRHPPRFAASIGAGGGLLVVLAALDLAGRLLGRPGGRVLAATVAAALAAGALGLLATRPASPLAAATVVVCGLAVLATPMFLLVGSDSLDTRSFGAPLLVGAIACGALFLAGPARRRPFLLSLALLALWIVLVTQFSGTPVLDRNAVRAATAAARPIVATGQAPPPGYEPPPTLQVPAPGFEPAPGLEPPPTFAPPPQPQPSAPPTFGTPVVPPGVTLRLQPPTLSPGDVPPAALRQRRFPFGTFPGLPSPGGAGVASLLLGTLYVVAAALLDRRRRRDVSTPFVAVGVLALVVGLIAITADSGVVTASFLAVALGAGLCWTGATNGRRLSTWLGAAGVVGGPAALTAHLTGSNDLAAAVGGLLVGLAMVVVAVLLAPTDQEPIATA